MSAATLFHPKNSFLKVGLAGLDPIGYTADALLGKKPPSAPAAPQVPTIDTAANSVQQQADYLRRRRGVLRNIYAGANATAPQVESKSSLGN